MTIQITSLDTQSALLFLLERAYKSEFTVISGLNQHPDGLNFYEWLYSKKLISETEILYIRYLLENEPD